MKKKRKIIYMFIIMVLVLTSCAKETKPPIENNDISEDVFKGVEESNNKKIDYKFNYGPVDIKKPVRIDDNNLYYDFKINNMGNEAEFAVSICIDGHPQSVELDGDKKEIQIVKMSEQEEKIFVFSINKDDLKLENGREHYIYPILIVEPNFVPNSMKEISHQGSINAVLPIKFSYDYNTDVDVEIEEKIKMTDDFKKKYKIDEEVNVKIVSETLKKRFAKSDDFSSEFNLSVVGNDYAKYNLFLVINNELKYINDKDFYKIELARGMQSSLGVKIEENLKNNDQVYFLLLPINDESRSSEAYKTRTIYIKD